MADPVYPQDLFPLPLVVGREVTNGETTIRTPMVSGRQMVRKTYDSVPATVPVSWIFKDEQVCVAFESWVAGALNNGERWFLLPIKLPAGKGPWRVRFVGQYRGPRMMGPEIWQIDSTVEIYTRPIIDGDWGGEYPGAIVYAGLIDLALNLEWPESPYQTHMGTFDRAVNEEWPQP